MFAPADCLYIDIGNSRLHWRYAGSDHEFCRSEAISELRRFLAAHPEITSLTAVSVAHQGVLDAIRSAAGSRACRVFSTLAPSLLRTDYRSDQLGLDRWLACLAVAMKAPSGQHIVVDAGTAVTIDFIGNGVHRGGWILPGYSRWHDALLNGTQIPAQAPVKGEAVPGQSTPEAIANGWVAGVLGALAEARKGVAKPAAIWLTGGDRSYLAHRLPEASVYRNLVLDGLVSWSAKMSHGET